MGYQQMILLAKVVNNIKEYGYDAALVTKEFSDVESLKTNHQNYL